MKIQPHITRREFLKITAASSGLFIPPLNFIIEDNPPTNWPKIQVSDLPNAIKDIISKVPVSRIDRNGYLFISSKNGETHKQAGLVQTQWNKERSTPSDTLSEGVPWAIVLHWFGNIDGYPSSIDGYMRGFDSIRTITDYSTRTSAHFLIGDEVAPVNNTSPPASAPLSILQTQKPADDGTPYLASHLREIDHQLHSEKGQYFVRAFYQLSYQEPGIHSILQDFYDGPRIDPNFHSIAVEISGYDFDSPDNAPSNQKIANVVSVIWAAMKRYKISIFNLLGHNEIQLGKSDPGKKFTSLIRYLIGIKALIEDDEQMKELVFGHFLYQGKNRTQAANKFFKFVYQYLLLVSTPQRVYQWESTSKYWFVYDLLFPGKNVPIATSFCMPVQEKHYLQYQSEFRQGLHEGVDIHLYNYNSDNELYTSPVHLIANGECIFAEEIPGSMLTKTVMFRHRQSDGAQVISIYAHLSEFGDVRVGKTYPMGHKIGAIGSVDTYINKYLHFAVAYGATWDSDLSQNPEIPLNGGGAWITRRFIPPMEFLNSKL